jgi:hypothetical protein
MKKAIFIFLICNLFILSLGKTPLYALQLNDEDKMTFFIKTSPSSSFYSTLNIQSDIMDSILNNKDQKTFNYPVISDAYLTMEHDGETQTYAITDSWNLVNLQKRKIIHLPIQVQNKLKLYIDILRAKHYGKMLPWKKAKKIIPMKSIFEVIDLETGLSFNVQRRAGSRHADVQPLTYEDTKVMKQIYKGKWSWNRKSVIVKKGDVMIAASMHGMPHGHGALSNGFPGHFCIHFLDSTTHRSKNMDPVHRFMVFKAAGKLNDYFINATPYELVDLFLLSLNQQDPYLLKMTLNQNEYKQTDSFIDKVQFIEGIYKKSQFAKEDGSNLMAFEIPVDVLLYAKGQKKEKKTLIFLLTRNSLTDRWGIDLNSVHNDL